METINDPIPEKWEEEIKKEAEKKPEPQMLAVNESGGLILGSIQDQLSFAQRLIKEGMVSTSFKTPQQVLIGFQYAKSLGMNEILAMKMMYVVNGKPCLYSEGPLTLCLRSGQVAGMSEFYCDANFAQICFENKNLNAPVYAAITRIWRKGDPNVQEDFFTLDDLAKAGLDKNNRGEKKDVWEKWLKLMMRYKARSMALKSKFADHLAGVYISEYDFDFMPGEEEKPPLRKIENVELEKINNTFLPNGDGV